MLSMKRDLKFTILILMSVVCLGPDINLCKGQLQFRLSNNATDFELQPTLGSAVSFPSWSYNTSQGNSNANLQLISTTVAEATGRVLYRNPIEFINQSSGTVFSFRTYFRFQITTDKRYGYSGDGFAFFITPDITLPNDASGASMGLLSMNETNWNATDSSRHLLALEFDIYQNQQVSDPSSSHIGIDINGLQSVLTYDTDLKQNSDLYLYNNSVIDAWLQYNGENGIISVWAAAAATDQTYSTQQPSNAPILITYNISYFTNLFQNKMYVGLTAASGASNMSVSVLSWSFIIYDNQTTAQSPINDNQTTAQSSENNVYIAAAPIPTAQHSSNRPRTLLVALPVASFAIIAAFILVFLLMSRRINSLCSSASARAALATIIPNVSRYSYRDLRRATQGFRQQNKIGEGGFSEVYKGTLSNGSAVAVKKLKEGVRMEDEFASEVRVISRIRHRNLIELQGWCYDSNEAMLVYPFMEKGSLDGYIFDKIKKGMKGSARLEILKGVAAALEYLHEGLGERVLHRDVKAANVLLTDNWEAKLGDFGLARLIDAENYNTAVTMTAAGTPGYVAPEVIYTGKVSDKADVYSYGVLMLEVACGRRVVDGRLPPQEMRLIDWVWLLHQSGKLMEALDPRLTVFHNSPGNCRGTLDNDMAGGDDIYDVAQLEWKCVLHVALLCCLPYPEGRPTMRDVRQVLRERIIVDLPQAWPSYASPSPSAAGSFKAFSSDFLSASTVSSGKSSFSLVLGHSTSRKASFNG